MVNGNIGEQMSGEKQTVKMKMYLLLGFVAIVIVSSMRLPRVICGLKR